MANVAALRKKAADFEQRKQLDKAIATYREILDVFDAGGDQNIDIGLYNRVGDLLVRQGSTSDAVTLYERAVDLYAESGFFNNAIALCNKILRTSPGRATVYYKLGEISAAKGFNADAKLNFLEYADRMQKAGEMEEAFRALKEFADLCPDQDDTRLMLAEQLTKAGRKAEALEQLHLLHARYQSGGRVAEAQATFERMKALDPNVEVKAAESGEIAKSDDLVFIDLDAPSTRASRRIRGGGGRVGITLTPSKTVDGRKTPVAQTPSASHESAPEPSGTSTPDLPLIDIDAPAAPVLPAQPPTPAEPAAETAAKARRSGPAIANNAGTLREQLAVSPDDWALHRQLAEALLDDGDREGGLRELELALVGYEKANDLETARSIADEILRLDPGSVRHHQKRVEYAFRSNDKARLAEAYLELAGALFRDGQAEKSKQVYRRVLELSPDDARAHSALESLGTPPAPTEAPGARRAPGEAGRASTPSKAGRRYTGSIDAQPPAAKPAAQPAAQPAAKPAARSAPRPVAKPPAEAAPAGGDDEYVSLGDWLRDQEAPKSTRMVVGEDTPTGDEQADFADMLKKFKQGVAENVDAEDHEAHYDLGVGYKEMGLLDEAISEFQKALRGPQNRLRTYEALGQAFIEKKQLPVAAMILQRALNEPGARDDQLVGVLYLLGHVDETLGKLAEAKTCYERVFGVDIQFRDVGDRLNAVDEALAS